MTEFAYIFPKNERDRITIGIGLFLFYVIYFVVCLIVILTEYRTNTHYETILLVWAIIFSTFLIASLLYGLKDLKYRRAQYAFAKDSVSVRIGGKNRSLHASDDVQLSRRILRVGEKGAELRMAFWAIWKEAPGLLSDIIEPYRALKEYPILLLPDTEEVRRNLSTVFGEREALYRENTQNDTSDYVFTDRERGRYNLMRGFFPLIYVFFLTMFSILIRNYWGTDSFKPAMVVWCLLFSSFLFLQIYALTSKKCWFASFWFSKDAVYMRFGKEEHSIRTSDAYLISPRTMLFGERYGGPRKEIFIALWKSGAPAPKDETDPMRLIRKTDVILLPDTAEVRERLRETLDVKTIGYWTIRP